MEKDKIEVGTPFGKLVAELSTDPEYPGIWICIRKIDPEDGHEYETPLALVESQVDSTTEDRYRLWVGVWGDYEDEEITHTIDIEHKPLS